MWANYKVMTKCLLGFFQYLDYHFVSRRHVPSLNDLAILCFHNLVSVLSFMHEVLPAVV
jgi:hypothetical protein